MGEAVYGFDAPDIDGLAAALGRALAVPLHHAFSPMDGDWYSSTDPAAWQMLREHRPGQPNPKLEGLLRDLRGRPNFTLKENDPEPGYTAPLYPGGGRFLLYASGTPTHLDEVEERLQVARLPYRRLKRFDGETPTQRASREALERKLAEQRATLSDN